MALVDKSGRPIALSLHDAAPHEVGLVMGLFEKCLTREKPKRIIGDKAYDSDPLDEAFAKLGVEVIAPHRKNRKKEKSQDGRSLRRMRRRFCVERYQALSAPPKCRFAWLHNSEQSPEAIVLFRRLPIRYERKSGNYFGFILLATIIIYIKYLF